MASAVGLALALSACSASGATTPTKPATTPKAPGACLHALDLADLLLNDAAQAIRIDGQIFAGTATVTNSAHRLSEIAAAQSAIGPEYDTAKASCRATR
jgi:hypothetical protein